MSDGLVPVLQADSQSGGVAPTVSTVGFPDSTVRERRDGVPAAIEIPVAPITVSLAWQPGTSTWSQLGLRKCA